MTVPPDHPDPPSVSSSLREIKNHLHREYGIYFSEDKLYSLRQKLQRRINRIDCDSFEEYKDRLIEDPDEIPYFLDAVTTNKTHFFREPDGWDFLRDWFQTVDYSGLRIWSAACSSGQEPYTAAILASEYYDGSYRVLATDVSETIIRVGSRGIYPARERERVENYNPEFAQRYLSSYDDDANTVRVIRDLRRQVYFRQFNLKFHTVPFEQQFHLILLRNVLLYFDVPMIQSVISHCESLLEPGGYLLIGQTESLNEIDHSLTKHHPSLFQKPT